MYFQFSCSAPSNDLLSQKALFKTQNPLQSPYIIGLIRYFPTLNKVTYSIFLIIQAKNRRKLIVKTPKTKKN